LFSLSQVIKNCRNLPKRLGKPLICNVSDNKHKCIKAILELALTFEK
jgi:hypothetical protein